MAVKLILATLFASLSITYGQPKTPDVLKDAHKVIKVSFAVERAETKGEAVIVYAQPMLPITLELQGLDNQGADGIMVCNAFDKNLAPAGKTRVDVTMLDCGKRGIFAVAGIDFSKED